MDEVIDPNNQTVRCHFHEWFALNTFYLDIPMNQHDSDEVLKEKIFLRAGIPVEDQVVQKLIPSSTHYAPINNISTLYNVFYGFPSFSVHVSPFLQKIVIAESAVSFLLLFIWYYVHNAVPISFVLIPLLFMLFLTLIILIIEEPDQSNKHQCLALSFTLFGFFLFLTDCLTANGNPKWFVYTMLPLVILYNLVCYKMNWKCIPFNLNKYLIIANLTIFFACTMYYTVEVLQGFFMYFWIFLTLSRISTESFVKFFVESADIAIICSPIVWGLGHVKWPWFLIIWAVSGVILGYILYIKKHELKSACIEFCTNGLGIVNQNSTLDKVLFYLTTAITFICFFLWYYVSGPYSFWWFLIIPVIYLVIQIINTIKFQSVKFYGNFILINQLVIVLCLLFLLLDVTASKSFPKWFLVPSVILFVIWNFATYTLQHVKLVYSFIGANLFIINFMCVLLWALDCPNSSFPGWPIIGSLSVCVELCIYLKETYGFFTAVYVAISLVCGSLISFFIWFWVDSSVWPWFLLLWAATIAVIVILVKCVPKEFQFLHKKIDTGSLVFIQFVETNKFLSVDSPKVCLKAFPFATCWELQLGLIANQVAFKIQGKDLYLGKNSSNYSNSIQVQPQLFYWTLKQSAFSQLEVKTTLTTQLLQGQTTPFILGVCSGVGNELFARKKFNKENDTIFKIMFNNGAVPESYLFSNV